LALKGQDDDALEEVLDFLYGKTVTREKSELASLFRAYRAFTTVAQSRDSSPESQQEKSDKLKEFVREYFKEATHETDEQKIGLVIPPLDQQVENAVRSDVRQFVMTHTDHTWTGRAVARWRVFFS
jgi:DNA-binding protein H-NS